MARPAKRHHHLKKLMHVGITLPMAVALLKRALAEHLATEHNGMRYSRYSCNAVWNSVHYHQHFTEQVRAAYCLSNCYGAYHAKARPAVTNPHEGTNYRVIEDWSKKGIRTRTYEIRKQMIADYSKFLQGIK